MKNATKTDGYTLQVEIKPDRVVLELTDNSKYKDRRTVHREDFESTKLFGLFTMKCKFNKVKFEAFCLAQKEDMIKTYKESIAVYYKLSESTSGLDRIVKRKQSDDDFSAFKVLPLPNDQDD